MDFFLILQIIFDAFLLFGILFLFHFFVNQQQKKKEELDIVKNIQVQEMKENLEKILFETKEFGLSASDGFQNKIKEFEVKIKNFYKNIDKIEKRLNFKFNLTEMMKDAGRDKDNEIVCFEKNEEDKFFLEKKDANKIGSGVERKKSDIPKTDPSIGFSSAVIKQVYKMVDGNKEIGEVVKATKLTRAEISLILNLRENRFTALN